MAINIRTTINGWIVEVWRARTLPREEFVFTREQVDEMFEFVRQTASEHI